jgi:hypothetical protein
MIRIGASSAPWWHAAMRPHDCPLPSTLRARVALLIRHHGQNNVWMLALFNDTWVLYSPDSRQPTRRHATARSFAMRTVSRSAGQLAHP